MSTSRNNPYEVVDESISHFRTQKLDNGKVRLTHGGRTVIADTFFEALERYAKRRQKDIEESADHLKQDKIESISFMVTHPEMFTEPGVPVVYGVDSHNQKRILRVCDTMTQAERVKAAYESTGSIQSKYNLKRVAIDRVEHGGAT